MALGISTSKMKEMVEKTLSTNMKVIKLQSRFAEDLMKRNTAVMFEMADARIGHLQELTHIKSFSDLYENTLEIEGSMRDKIVMLYQDNTQSAKDFGEELKNVLEVDDMIARMKSFSESVGGKVKSASDTTVAKVNDISDATVTTCHTPVILRRIFCSK